MNIIMTPSEVNLLTAFMDRCEHYFEYGMGGSTYLASKSVKKSITAIDSDPTWIEKVKQNIGETELCVSLQHVDIGKIGGWGTPIGLESKDKFPSYSKFINNVNVDEIDLCLVDGRFRVACFLESLARLRSDSIIAIHDYAVRGKYHVVEEYARPIASVEQLTFFVRRPLVSIRLIEETAESYRYNHD